MSDYLEDIDLTKMIGGRNLYLIGMMGSGKSSTGPLLAEALDYGFVDADDVLEKAAKKSISEMFANDGEDNFRENETKVLKSIGQHYSLVIATGGGIVIRSENWGVLHQGIVIWLDPGRERLLRRLQSDLIKRPLIDKADPIEVFDSLYSKREPLYQQADLRIQIGDESPEVVMQNILSAMPSIIKTQEAPI